MGAGENSVELRDYLGMISRHRAYLILGPLLGLLASAVALNLVPPAYTAAAEVMARNVTTQPFDPSGPGIDRTLSMPTERQVAMSQDVAREAAKELGPAFSARGLRENLSVRVPESTRVLRFEFTAEDPAAAAAGANAFAQAYLKIREQTVVSDAEAVQKAITTRLTELGTRLRTLAREIAGKSPETTTALRSERDQLNAQAGELRKRADALAVVDTRPGYLTQAAQSPEYRSAPSRKNFLAVGGAAGLLLGLMLAFAVQILDRRVRTARELAAVLDAPALGSVRPAARGLGVRVSGQPGPVDEKSLRLAARLINHGFTGPTRTLAVVSPTPQVDLPGLALSLGSALASLSRNVLVLDPASDATPLRFPGEHASAVPDGSAEPGTADGVLLLLPARPTAVDLLKYARSAEGAIVVADPRRTRFADVEELRELLAEFGLDPVGGLILKPAARSDRKADRGSVPANPVEEPATG
ncbi:hypothetical protein [Rhizohabitans arisaemae]|uniref:hypothetical protein n=1 Tax=Rhizohabitans arisaemae TaxID=2720610 RepID=UPI0024B180A1|nr:hypothetical protein [Rhizohabitans arisaemae]